MTVTTSVHPAYPRLQASIDEIIPEQLYIGNLSAALSPAVLSKHGITHTISVCPEHPSTGDHHLSIAVDDSEYADLLIRLPSACEFIDSALTQGGRVLVHCVMGVSRSATVVAAYLMKVRGMTPTAAIMFIRNVRACVRPNYGFIKQLDIFAACDHNPHPQHSTYTLWKRRQEQHVTNFLNQMIDTTLIVPEQLYLSSEFPGEPRQAEALLIELGITHLLSVVPSKVPQLPSNIKHCRISQPGISQSELLLALPECCTFIKNAVSSGGMVLVHSTRETRACIVVASYLMASSNLSVREVCALIEKELPLFEATANVKKHLELFESCGYEPTADHPLVQAWTGLAAASSLINSISASVLSETGVDISAFGKTLTNVAARSRSKSIEVKVMA